MMETNQHEGSSEETDRFDRENDSGMGTGRSYECVFCKRGFTTAQALGGHMNIHRKERSSKARPPSDFPSLSSKVDEEFPNFRANPSLIQSYAPPNHHHHHYDMPHHEVHINYQTFFPESSSWSTINRPSSLNNYGGDVCVQTPHNLNLFGEDWQRSLSLQIGPSSVDDSQDKVEDGNEDDELDLELRLGHDP